MVGYVQGYPGIIFHFPLLHSPSKVDISPFSVDLEL